MSMTKKVNFDWNVHEFCWVMDQIIQETITEIEKPRKEEVCLGSYSLMLN